MYNIKKLRGFTLTELMITVAIVAVLASIGYPSYTANVRRGRRAEAKAILLQAAQWLERFATSNNGRYTDNPPTNDDNVSFLTSGLATNRAVNPNINPSDYYDIAISTATPITATTFTLTATPTAGGTMVNDECQTLTLTNTGIKGVIAGSDGTEPSKTAAECWR